MKNNSKLFLGILIGIIISSVVVYAVDSVSAINIIYTDKNNNEVTVQDALDNIYTSLDNYFPTYYDSVFTGKDQTASNNAQPVVLSKQAEPGKYLVVVTFSSVAGSSLASSVDQASGLNNLTGCSSKSILVYQRYGAYKDSGFTGSNNTVAYSNFWNTVFSCTVNQTSTITYTQSDTSNDKNASMVLLKY